MAIAMKFTESKRKLLAVLLTSLHGILVLFGLAGMLFDFYINVRIKEFDALIYGNRGNIISHLWGCTGAMVVIENGLLVLICSKMISLKTRHTPRRPWLYMLILSCQIYYFLTLLCITFILSRYDNSVSKSFESGIPDAVLSYSYDPARKANMDELQAMYHCCGVNGPEDWFYIRWMPEDSSHVHHFQRRSLNMDRAEYKLERVPFSCCVSRVEAPCNNENLANDTGFSTIYKVGCVATGTTWMTSVLRGGSFVLFLVTVTQMVAIMLFRLLHTSCDMASETGSPSKPSTGYLCCEQYTKSRNSQHMELHIHRSSSHRRGRSSYDTRPSRTSHHDISPTASSS